MQRAPDKTLALLREVRQTFDGLVDHGCDLHDCLICLNDQVILLRFAGGALTDLVLPALEHLLVDADEGCRPDLTVCLWDEETTGAGMPSSPWSVDDFTSRREICGANGPGVKVAYDMYCGIFSVVSLDDACAYWWISSPDRLPAYERAAPLREILQAWCEHKQGVFVHAAAVGDANGAVLLVGKGGSGKSTTALAAQSAGLGLIGEDYCLLSDCGDAPRVHSLFASAKLTDHSLSMFPELETLAVNRVRKDRDKAVILGAGHLRMLRSALVRAIVLPSVDPAGETGLEPVSAAKALFAIAPSSIFQLAGTGGEAMDAFRALVDMVPAYRLRIGGHPDAAAALLKGLL